MFRRLSLVGGISAAVLGSVMVAAVLSRPSSPFSPLLATTMWLVATALCFFLGRLAMRLVGWLVIGILPRSAAPRVDEEA